MKRFFISILTLCGVFFSVTHATYTPTTSQKNTIQSLTQQINTIIDGDRSLQYNVIRHLKTLLIKYPNTNSFNHYLVHELHTAINQDFQNAKISNKNKIKKAYQNIVNQQSANIHNKQSLPSACYTYINDLDDVAFAYNISLPVLIATRYREFSCTYSRPANNNGPMQIITRDYGSGPFDNHEQFLQAMEDYAHFANNKHTRYNRANRHDPAHVIALDYTHISYKDIVKYGALYNGLGTIEKDGKTIVNIYGNIYPARPGYVFQNFGDEDSNVRDGIMSASIKAAQRLLTNQ